MQYTAPNLPGYVSNATKAAPKRQTLTYGPSGAGVNLGPEGNKPLFYNSGNKSSFDPDAGVVMSRATEAESRRNDLYDITTGLSSMSVSNFVTVSAWWKETLAIGNFTHRIRIFQISMNIKDSEITITERKTSNSGLPQGVFLKKIKVPKKGGFLSIEDILPGKTVVIYGRTFNIFSCDPLSRKLLQSRGIACPENQEAPVDPAGKANAAKVTDRVANAEFKKFNEAMLGSAVQSTARLGEFLEFSDHPPLAFSAVWRDNRLYGKLNRYSVLFYLEDRTFQIQDVVEENSGTDQFHKMYARQTIAKDYRVDANAIGRQKDDANIYDVPDLYIGNSIDVFGKTLLINDCADHTRRFFKKLARQRPGKFREQPVRIYLPEDKPKSPPRQQTPLPHMGGVVSFGSEADSVQSCLSLHPKKLKDDPEKVKSNQKNALKFGARLVTDKPQDQDRRFVVAFYLFDKTISVFETAQKNSGIVPGKFLKRTSLKNPDTGRGFEHDDLYIGCTLEINTFKFILLDMDTFTVNYAMNRPEQFPWADIGAHLAALRDNYRQGTLRGQAIETGSGPINEQQLIEYGKKYLGFSPGAAICFSRFFLYGDQELDFAELREFIACPADLTSLIAADTCDTVLANSKLDPDTRELKKAVMRVFEGFQQNQTAFSAIFTSKADDLNNLSKEQVLSCLKEASYLSNVPYGKETIDQIAKYFFPDEDIQSVGVHQFVAFIFGRTSGRA